MNIRHRIPVFALLFIIIGVLLAPACGKGLSSSDIVKKAANFMQGVNDYHVSETTTIITAGGPEGSISGTVISTGNGIIDEANQAFAFEISTEASFNYDPSQLIRETLKMYMLNNIVYVLRDDGTGGINAQPVWTNHPVGQDDWKQISFVDIKQIQGLFDSITVETVSHDIIAEIPCYALEVAVDPKKLFNMMSQPDSVSGDADSVSYWDNMSKEFSTKIWVSEADYSLIKLEYTMSFKIAPQYLSYPEGSPEAEFSLQVSALLGDYNSAGPVVVPPEALT